MIVWDDLIAELVACAIGGWDEIERTMTLPRYYALTRYWQRHPPVHLLFAAWIGHGVPAAGAETADLGDLVALAGPGGLMR